MFCNMPCVDLSPLRQREPSPKGNMGFGIKGQDGIVKFLRSAIRNNRVSHAYIFAGPEGSGRALLARDFAKALNCADARNAPCGSCLSCLKIERDIHPEVTWIRGGGKSGQIGVDKVRELERRVALKPYEGRYKVCVLVNAHFMTVEAANSFLKTLEEPPLNSVFVLIAEKISQLPSTVVSRCQVLRLKPIRPEELSSILVSDYGMDRKKAEFISRFSEGRLGRALGYGKDVLVWKNSVLDEFSGDECAENYTPADRKKLAEKLNVLASWYRDILVFKAAPDENLLIHSDRLGDIERYSRQYGQDELVGMFESVLSAKENIMSNVNPKLALSAMLKEFR